MPALPLGMRVAVTDVSAVIKRKKGNRKKDENNAIKTNTMTEVEGWLGKVESMLDDSLCGVVPVA